MCKTCAMKTKELIAELGRMGPFAFSIAEASKQILITCAMLSFRLIIAVLNFVTTTTSEL